MAIAPTRFTVSDKETNLPTIDFMSVKSSEVLNKALENGLKLSEAIQSIASLVQGDGLKNALKDLANDALGTVVSTATGIVSDYVGRAAETVLGSVSNLASQGMACVDKLAGPALEGMEGLKSTIRQLDPQGYIKTVSDALQTTVGPTIANLAGAVDTITGTTSLAKAYGDLVGSITNGKYSAVFSNDSMAEKITTLLTRNTADLGMTGVFTSFVERYGSTAGIANAGAALLKYASGQGNTNLLTEIATSAVGRVVAEKVPGAVGLVSQGTRINTGTAESAYGALYTKVTTAFSSLDPNWNQLITNAGPVLSTQKLMKASDDFKTLLSAKVYETPPVVSTALAAAPVPASNRLYAAALVATKSPTSYFHNNHIDALLKTL